MLSFRPSSTVFRPMDLVLALVVLAAAIAMLAYPLYRAQTQGLTFQLSTLDDLLAQRDGVYAMLRDLDLDKQLGKLDDADYTTLREKYLTRATELMQELDALRGGSAGNDASAEIEKQVAALRKTTDHRPQTTEKKSAASGQIDLYCSNCGRPYNTSDKFCARCGRALN